MSSKKVVELVNKWAEFEAQYPQAGVEQFCHWVLQSKEQAAAPNEAESGYSNNGYAAQLLSRLARYAHIYSKDILEQHGIESVYEFGFMMSVLMQGKPKKSELIEKQLTGFTSGIGIINRLLKRGLLVEMPDENDKRTKRISITPQGFATLQACIPDMEKLSGLVFKPLSNAEINLLLAIMQKLDAVHATAYSNAEPTTIEGLSSRIENSINSISNSY